MSPCPKPFPEEFRRDVVAVARSGEAPLSQIAKDFGISESCLHRWLKLADDRRRRPPGHHARRRRPRCGSCKKRNRLLEQENEILRRAAAYLGQGSQPKMIVPAGP